jgi:hypothetical protein
MIQERANALVALIARQRELNVQIRQLEGFRGQLQEVTQAVDRLAPLMRAWRLFRDRGIGTAIAEAQTSSLLQQIAQLRERFESDHASILGPNRLASVRGVHPLANALQMRLLRDWQEYAGALVPSVNDEVLNVLSRIPALRTSVDAVWAGLRDLNDRLQRLPATTADVDTFEMRAADVRRKWNAFDSTHLSPEILQFLKDAGGTGATLNGLTESVRNWLRENNLTGAFRIHSIAAVVPGR